MINSQPWVSIVVPFLNSEKYLEEAIRSVLAQTFDRWELILVDDGSSDGSGQIARDHAAGDRRIRYLHHPGHQNLGTSAARNLGIRESRGTLVSFLDSDDVWLPILLERHVEHFDKHPAIGMVYGPVERWYSWSGEPADATKDFVAMPLRKYDALIEPPRLVPLILQIKFAVPLGFTLRREVVLEVEGFEDEFRGMYDDQVFLCKVGLKYPVFVMAEPLYRYRRHSESIIWTAAGERLDERMRFLKWLDSYLNHIGENDSAVWKALKQEKRAGIRERLASWRTMPRRALTRLRKHVAALANRDRQD